MIIYGVFRCVNYEQTIRTVSYLAIFRLLYPLNYMYFIFWRIMLNLLTSF